MRKLHRPECPIRTEDAICCSIACICGTLQACEDRVAAAFHQLRKDDRKEWERFARDQFDAGYAAGLNAAREAVEAIPAPYKAKGQYETYGPYNEGRADCKDLCESAIDALREKQ